MFEFLLAWEDLESFVFVRDQSELSEEKTKAAQQHWQVDSTRLQSIVSITPPVVLQFWSFSFKAKHPTFISIRMFTLLMSCYKPLFLMTSDFRGGLSSRRRTSPS